LPPAPPPAPAAPEKPALTTADGEIAASWTAVASATAYEVWYGETDNTENARKLEGETGETSAKITGLENGKVYFVWIRAKSSHGTSGFSPGAAGTCVAAFGTISINFDAASNSLKAGSETVALSKSNANQRAVLLKAASGYQSYRWILDDLETTLGTDPELALDALKLEAGTHRLVLFVTQGGVPYSSSEIKVTVEN
jgi:hypothetical protein